MERVDITKNMLKARAEMANWLVSSQKVVLDLDSLQRNMAGSFASAAVETVQAPLYVLHQALQVVLLAPDVVPGVADLVNVHISPGEALAVHQRLLVFRLIFAVP